MCTWTFGDLMSRGRSTRARALRPSSMSLLYDQAFLDVARGDLEGARQALREAERVTPYPPTVVGYVALVRTSSGSSRMPGQRLPLTPTPAALDSGRAHWAFAFAQTYWRRGDEQRARAYADTASKAYGELLRHMRSTRYPVLQAHGSSGTRVGLFGTEARCPPRGSEALSASKLVAGAPRRLSYVRYLVVRNPSPRR